MFTRLCPVSLKTFLLTLELLFYFRFFHFILGSNPINLTSYSYLLYGVLLLHKIQLLQFIINLFYFNSLRMPLTKFLQCVISLTLFSQQHLQTLVRVMSPAVESFHNLIPAFCTFFLYLLAFYLKFVLFLIIRFFLDVLECLTCIFQFTPCNVVLFFYRCMGFQ